MIPVGLTCSYQEQKNIFRLKAEYSRAVHRAGGLPLVLATLEPGGVAAYFKFIHGLLLCGGSDVDPFFFGEEPLPGCGEITPPRDALEIALTRIALERGLPLLAVCRGVQLLNIACGGNIYQDLSLREKPCLKHWQNAPGHYPTHSVVLESGTMLQRILGGKDCIRVNTFHHQAVHNPGAGLIVAARAPDGLVEALEMPSRSFVLGVQWHPEDLSLGEREGGQALFDAFLQAAAHYRPVS